MSDYFNDLVNETNLENALKWTWLEWEEYWLDEDLPLSTSELVIKYSNDVYE